MTLRSKSKSDQEKRRGIAALLSFLLALLLAGAALLSACGNGTDAEKIESTKEADLSEEGTEGSTEENGENSAETEKTETEPVTEETEKTSGTETEEPETESSPESEEPSERSSETAPKETLPPRDKDAVIDLSTTLYTYEMMSTDLQYLEQEYPSLISVKSAGTTADGRELYSVSFGDPDASRVLMIVAATHGREYMTAQLVMKQLEYYCAHYQDGEYNGKPFSELFRDTRFVIVPMVNPDGVSVSQLGEAAVRRPDLLSNLRNIYASDLAAGYTTYDYATYLTRWKANLLGVDLNRNFSPGWETVSERSTPSADFFKGNTPGDQAEASALMALVDENKPRLVLSYHSYGDLVYWQYGQTEPLWSANQTLAQHISNLTGHHLAGYSNEAGFTNWCIIERKIPAVVIETGTVPTPLPLSQFAPLWEKHRMMWAMLADIYR